MKRARTQYEGGHPGYPGPGAGAGMWAGRWAAASPGIKTEAEKPGAGGGPQHGASTELGGSPHHHAPAPAPSSYPATFHEGQIVSVQPATTAADILYDSINISQANIYPGLSSSLGKHCSHACISRCPLSSVSVLPRSHPAAAPLAGEVPMLNFTQKLQSTKICLGVLNQVQNIEPWEPLNLSRPRLDTVYLQLTAHMSPVPT